MVLEAGEKVIILLNKLKLVLHHFRPLQTVHVNGRSTACQLTKTSYFLPLEKYDPINDPDSMGEEEVIVSTMDYSRELMQITW